MPALPATTKLVFLRHGESEGNKDKTMQGRGDYPLSALGRAQASSARDPALSSEFTIPLVLSPLRCQLFAEVR